MLTTLRRQLILSHVLPLLVIVPVMGITLIYVLETNVLLPDLARELVGHAALAAELARQEPDLWTDPAQAEAFAIQISQYLAARVMLLDKTGRLLASSDPADISRLDQRLDLSPLADVLAGRMIARTSYSQQYDAEIADVWRPVLGPGNEVIGIIRLSHSLGGVEEQFLRLRYLILSVLVTGLLLGAAIGLLLALNMERPLQQITRTIYGLAGGQQTTPLTMQGPAEIRLVLRAINTLGERLHSLEQARRRLLANLVHELGRPLGALRSAIQAMLGGADNDVALRRELLAGMDEEVGRLQSLLEDLAQLHGQVLGTLELDRRPISLDTWLTRLLATWREEAQKKGLQWQVNLPPGLPTFEADPDRLAQALGNLISNAIKYTPPGGTLSVEAGHGTSAVWLRVSDSGPGIDPEDQAQIFTPFYRGHSTSRFPQGLGLGLTIARDLVTAHGGQMDVESTPGRGSRFTIRIPLSPGKS